MFTNMFTFDDSRPISFSLGGVSSGAGQIVSTIAAHGGAILSPLLANFYVVDRRTRSNPLSHLGNAPVHVTWIRKCDEMKRLVPIYPFLLDDEDSLHGLDDESRDMAELVKQLILDKGESAYKSLHRRFPHRTAMAWRRLHEEHHENVKNAVSLIEEGAHEIRLKAEERIRKKTDQTLRAILDPGAAVTKPKVYRGRDENDPERGMQLVVSTGPDLPRPALKRRKIENAESSRFKMPISKLEKHEMSSFIESLGRKPVAADWVDFYEKHPLGKTRTSSGAWFGLYQRNLEFAKEGESDGASH